jgi:hypothetical protein
VWDGFISTLLTLSPTRWVAGLQCVGRGLGRAECRLLESRQTVVTWDPPWGEGRARTRALRPMDLLPGTPDEEYSRSPRA